LERERDLDQQSAGVDDDSNKTLVAGFYFIPTNKVWTGASVASGNWTDSGNWIPRPPAQGIF